MYHKTLLAITPNVLVLIAYVCLSVPSANEKKITKAQIKRLEQIHSRFGI
jgi:hypothetical protein